MTYQSINPFNAELLESFPVITNEQLGNNLDLAGKAFTKWKKTTFHQRRKLMYILAELLEENAEIYAKTITIEMGKPLKQSVAEVQKCAWVCRHYGVYAQEILSPKTIATDASESYVRFDPLGVIFCIMPWNFPFWQVFRFSVPALMAGNTVVMKHAANVPQCAIAIENIFKEAGFEEGIFQNLFIEHEQTETVIADNRVAGVTLTGSGKAGSIIGSLAGKHIKPSVLELGGSDAFIVMEDADLELAAEKAVQSRTLNNGQSCVSAKRFIVHEKVYDRFLEKFRMQMEFLQHGDPLDEDTRLGPLARKDLRDELAKQVDQSVEKGARIVTGGKIPEDKGYFYPPTILDNIPLDSPAYLEELFGPVAAVFKVKDADEAIRIANDHEYGLGAAIFTANEEEAKDMARWIEAGSVFVNEVVKSDPRLPFGGVKKSGYGRELSSHGIREFVNIKTVYLA